MLRPAGEYETHNHDTTRNDSASQDDDPTTSLWSSALGLPGRNCGSDLKIVVSCALQRHVSDNDIPFRCLRHQLFCQRRSLRSR